MVDTVVTGKQELTGSRIGNDDRHRHSQRQLPVDTEGRNQEPGSTLGGVMSHEPEFSRYPGRKLDSIRHINPPDLHFQCLYPAIRIQLRRYGAKTPPAGPPGSSPGEQYSRHQDEQTEVERPGEN